MTARVGQQVNNFNWTPESENELKERHARGESYYQIAEAILGDAKAKSAISGKAKRLGLEKRKERYFHSGVPPADAASVYETLRQIAAETPPMSATGGWFRTHYVAQRSVPKLCESTARVRLWDLANSGSIEFKTETTRTGVVTYLWRIRESAPVSALNNPNSGSPHGLSWVVASQGGEDGRGAS